LRTLAFAKEPASDDQALCCARKTGAPAPVIRPGIFARKPIKIEYFPAAADGLWPAQVQELGNLDKGLMNY
jgi:hypothetical protein